MRVSSFVCRTQVVRRHSLCAVLPCPLSRLNKSSSICLSSTKGYYRESKEQTLSNWSHGKEHCKRAKRPEFQSQLCHLLTLTLGKSQPLWASVSLSVKQKNNP